MGIPPARCPSRIMRAVDRGMKQRAEIEQRQRAGERPSFFAWTRTKTCIHSLGPLCAATCSLVSVGRYSPGRHILLIHISYEWPQNNSCHQPYNTKRWPSVPSIINDQRRMLTPHIDAQVGSGVGLATAGWAGNVATQSPPVGGH